LSIIDNLALAHPRTTCWHLRYDSPDLEAVRMRTIVLALLTTISLSAQHELTDAKCW